MIKNVSFKNFYSFSEETNISFNLGQKPSESYYDIKYRDERLNKVIAVIGANGSGKTQFIRPLAFLSWFIASSYTQLKPDDDIPYRPHILHIDKSSTVSIVFIIDDVEYKYELELFKNEVLNESLYKKTSKYFSYLFKRERVSLEDNFTYKNKDFDFSNKLASKIKENASIISAAYMNDSSESKKFIDYFANQYSYNVNMSGRENYSETVLLESAKYFNDNSQSSDYMRELLCNMDLGLNDVKIDEIEIRTEENKLEKIYMPMGVHGNRDNGKYFELPFFDESNGTKSLFIHLRRILPILEKGGVVIIDEIDNDLHPHMLPVLIDLFKFEHSNPHNAQIIFTCHTPEILNILNKHQVYLVEKDDYVSEAWRLDEMVGLRSDDNLYAKYYAGSLGATPDI